MSAKNKTYYEMRAQVAKALAHPSRLLILDALKRQDRCVCELTELVGADQSTVSKHLAVLRNAGLVSMRKEGSMKYYHLECPCLDGFLSCLESVIVTRLKAYQRGMVR